MSEHPDLAAEQKHVDLAYESLEKSRESAIELKKMVEVGRGGTNQARWEREVFYENIAMRLKSLDIGTRSLCFGRIIFSENEGGGSYHIGRIAVSGSDQEPLIVDWRAPVAEAFFRATGKNPQGLSCRRHFTSRGRMLLGLEDEFFGDSADVGASLSEGTLRGEGALFAALEENRSGRLGDIIGTIQAEQDEIIRSKMSGVLVVQGGPGTGKTVVALHRAAYLLYTNRFPLETQGVLVIGPNRLFLGYIEQVLPSLGEAGVEVAVLADLVSGVQVKGRSSQHAARIKGDIRMVAVLKKALRDRQRALPDDLVVKMGVRRLRVAASVTADIVREARMRFRDHNAARPFVERALFDALAEVHPDGKDASIIRDQTAHLDEVRAALLWMWPVLSPAQLLHDLFGSRALLHAAGSKITAAEQDALHTPWQQDMDVSSVFWTVDDVPLLDEAWELLGPRSRKKETKDVRTYGHIIVDEAQDLSPMQLRMLTRRSLNGSMTIVGDIAQSTGAWAHNDWAEILEHLPDRRQPQRRELTVGYRIPKPSMDVAAKILVEAAPELKPPVSVRIEGDEPRFISTEKNVFEDVLLRTLEEERQRAGSGNVAVVCPVSLVESVAVLCKGQRFEVGVAPEDGLNFQVTIVPVTFVKGLEVDRVVVVEPGRIVAEELQGARSLYVACTRATKGLVLVYADPLPEFLRSTV